MPRWLASWRLIPEKIEYLRLVRHHLGPIRETAIEQRGESWESVHSPFQILDRLHLREMQAMWDVT